MEKQVAENRLDIRRCSDEGIARLIGGVLNNTIRDWNTFSNIINKIDNKNASMKDRAIYELKSIIDFIQSNLFIIYTNGNCPQRDCVDGLINKITNRTIKEDLMNYALINETKWLNHNKNHEIKQIVR